MKRRGAAIGVVLVVLTLIGGLRLVETRQKLTIPVTYGKYMTHKLTYFTNRSRTNHGVRAIHRDASLDADARVEAYHIEAINNLIHSSSGHCAYWGENIGITDGNMLGLEQAFMASPEHRANILNRNFTKFGVAVVESRYKWAAVEFCK
jgi:uncharacterized protein YkwD